MQIVSSYGVEIKKKNIPLRSTLDIFRKAVSYLIGVYAESWEELSEIGNTQKRFNEAEHLVHETKKNRARFAFDRHFPQKKRDKFSLSITQAIANEPITQKHKDTHKKSIPVGSKANTGTKGFTAIVNTGENTNSTKV